jgi:hypothetical protein
VPEGSLSKIAAHQRRVLLILKHYSTRRRLIKCEPVAFFNHIRPLFLIIFRRTFSLDYNRDAASICQAAFLALATIIQILAVVWPPLFRPTCAASGFRLKSPQKRHPPRDP